MGKLKSVLPVAQAVHRLCRLGGMPEPRWLAAAERLGLHVREPAPKQRPRVWKPPRIEFPEDRVITSILARRPELKSLPVDHGAPSASSSSSPLREVALRAAEQLRAVPSWDRATRRTILAAAADEAAARAAGGGGSGGVSSSAPSSAVSAAAIGGGGLVEAAQRAEEVVLMQALARARAASRAGGGGGVGGTAAAAAAVATTRGAAARPQQQWQQQPRQQQPRQQQQQQRRQ